MEEAPQEEEDDVDMEDAPQDVGDAAASGGGLGEEDLDPFLALFDEDEGDDVSEDGVGEASPFRAQCQRLARMTQTFSTVRSRPIQLQLLQ